MALADFFGALARVRGTRALHPIGIGGTGTLWVARGPSHGVRMLEAGELTCQVRWSRAMGLRRGPDIEGLALRLPPEAGGGDLLLASTGTGLVTRHVLALRGAGRHGPLTSLLPLETAGGRLLLRLDPEPGSVGSRVPGADAAPPTDYRLLVAAPGRPWHRRGQLRITWDGQDVGRRHDPVGAAPAGTWVSPWWAGLRGPAYSASTKVLARPMTP